MRPAIDDAQAADLIRKAGQREVFCVKCEGCPQVVRAPNIEERNRRFARHVRNCRGLNFGRAKEATP